MFVEQPVLAEMLLEMLPPSRVWGPLALSEVARSEQALPCPSCGDAMKPTEICDVELDHCPKHGVWFDPDELRIALYRVADPTNPPPFAEWTPAMRLPPSPATGGTPIERAPAAQASPRRERPRVVFEVQEPGLPAREVVVEGKPVIKVGKAQTAQVSIASDPHVSRLHAVIEVAEDGILVIDLGSSAGTFVNEEKITKHAVVPGDAIRCAGTNILLVSAER